VLTAIDQKLLETIADLHGTPQGAYNIRKDGESISRSSSANVEIVSKKDKPGIDIIIKPGTKNESVHIPVILTAEGMHDKVYNTFDIGEGADVVIVAGCGIHSDGNEEAKHEGVHNFIIRKGARLKYVEKHYGEGAGAGKRVLNPVTILELHEDAWAELELVQIRGVDNTVRTTEAILHKGAFLLNSEKMLTHGDQKAESKTTIRLVGEDSSAQIISRSVAQDNSFQLFYPQIIGENKCSGHVQCDSIIMDKAQIRSIPEVAAYHPDATLVHEAAIGKIAGEQMIKLMTLGLNEEEAEATILAGFLK
jgi:uncharacterized protein